MFGYVRPVRTELLVRDYEFYRATYCGICRQMKAHTGVLSPLSLTYDSVFLALVRMCTLPDGDFALERHRCAAHPVRRRAMLAPNAATEYTARVFALLSYYKLRDDAADEHGIRRVGALAATPVLAGATRRAGYADLAGVIAAQLDAIRTWEKARCDSVDTVAEQFGTLLSAVFAHGYTGDTATVLSVLGDHLGRFIYAADAADDYEEDARRGRYNPYILARGGAPLDAAARQTIRTGLLLECRAIEGAVNLLPFGNRATLENLIRNIIYLGLPARIPFDAQGNRKEKTSE